MNWLKSTINNVRKAFGAPPSEPTISTDQLRGNLGKAFRLTPELSRSETERRAGLSLGERVAESFIPRLRRANQKSEAQKKKEASEVKRYGKVLSPAERESNQKKLKDKADKFEKERVSRLSTSERINERLNPRAKAQNREQYQEEYRIKAKAAAEKAKKIADEERVIERSIKQQERDVRKQVSEIRTEQKLIAKKAASEEREIDRAIERAIKQSEADIRKQIKEIKTEASEIKRFGKVLSQEQREKNRAIESVKREERASAKDEKWRQSVRDAVEQEKKQEQEERRLRREEADNSRKSKLPTIQYDDADDDYSRYQEREGLTPSDHWTSYHQLKRSLRSVGILHDTVELIRLEEAAVRVEGYKLSKAKVELLRWMEMA